MKYHTKPRTKPTDLGLRTVGNMIDAQIVNVQTGEVSSNNDSRLISY